MAPTDLVQGVASIRANTVTTAPPLDQDVLAPGHTYVEHQQSYARCEPSESPAPVHARNTKNQSGGGFDLLEPAAHAVSDSHLLIGSGSTLLTPEAPPCVESHYRNGPGAISYTMLRFDAEIYADMLAAKTVAKQKRRARIVAVSDNLLDRLEEAEKIAKRAMVLQYRLTVPPHVRNWIAETPGLAEPGMARLIGIVGDPTSRTLAQLRSYCGHGDATRRRRRGMTQEEAFRLGSPKAKSCLWTLAAACEKTAGGELPSGKLRARSPYRDVIDARRASTAGRDWTPGHSHNDALRIAGKAILEDLYRVYSGLEPFRT